MNVCPVCLCVCVCVFLCECTMVCARHGAQVEVRGKALVSCCPCCVDRLAGQHFLGTLSSLLPISPWGDLGVQKLHTAAASRGLWRSVLHLHVLQQMLYLLGHSPPASCPSTAGFILLCFETGSHNAAPAGLELVKIRLPLPPRFWN